MAFDEDFADRVRNMLGPRPGRSERKMFGGLAFLVFGNMACGIVGDELMVRVGPEAYEKALTLKGARPMDFTGRPMRGLVYVGHEGTSSSQSLKRWPEKGYDFAESLPKKYG